MTELLELVGTADKRRLPGQPVRRPETARGDRPCAGQQSQSAVVRRSHQRVGSGHHRSITELLKDINRRLGLTILLITHEMDVVKRICDGSRSSAGQLIEKDSVSEVFLAPRKLRWPNSSFSPRCIWISRTTTPRALSPGTSGDRRPLLRLPEFTGQSVDAPLLSEAARRFNVNNNIIAPRWIMPAA